MKSSTDHWLLSSSSDKESQKSASRTKVFKFNHSMTWDWEETLAPSQIAYRKASRKTFLVLTSGSHRRGPNAGSNVVSRLEVFKHYWTSQATLRPSPSSSQPRSNRNPHPALTWQRQRLVKPKMAWKPVPGQTSAGRASGSYGLDENNQCPSMVFDALACRRFAVWVYDYAYAK